MQLIRDNIKNKEKLEAIRNIVNSTDQLDSSKVFNIKEILGSDDSASKTFIKPFCFSCHLFERCKIKDTKIVVSKQRENETG